MTRLRRFAGEPAGSVLVETALGVSAVLLVALPFASLLAYSARASEDVAAVHAAARMAARAKDAGAPPEGITFRCADTASAASGTECPSSLERGTYVIARTDTTVAMPFGLSLRTDAAAVARVE